MPKTYDAIRTCKRQRRTPMRSPICSLEAPAKVLLPKYKKRVAPKKCQPRFGTKQGPKNFRKNYMPYKNHRRGAKEPPAQRRSSSPNLPDSPRSDRNACLTCCAPPEATPPTPYLIALWPQSSHAVLMQSWIVRRLAVGSIAL